MDSYRLEKSHLVCSSSFNERVFGGTKTQNKISKSPAVLGLSGTPFPRPPHWTLGTVYQLCLWFGLMTVPQSAAQPLHEVFWWHHNGQPHKQQRWVSAQGGDGAACRLVQRQQSISQSRYIENDYCWVRWAPEWSLHCTSKAKLTELKSLSSSVYTSQMTWPGPFPAQKKPNSVLTSFHLSHWDNWEIPNLLFQCYIMGTSLSQTTRSDRRLWEHPCLSKTTDTSTSSSTLTRLPVSWTRHLIWQKVLEHQFHHFQILQQFFVTIHPTANSSVSHMQLPTGEAQG